MTTTKDFTALVGETRYTLDLSSSIISISDNADKFKPQIEKHMSEMKTVDEVKAVLKLLYSGCYMQDTKEATDKLKVGCKLISEPLLKRSKELFLESKDKPAFLTATYPDSLWLWRDILNACNTDELKDLSPKSLNYLRIHGHGIYEEFFELREELRDWYLNQLDDKELLYIAYSCGSNIGIVNSLVVMKLFITRHKEGKLKSDTLKELIRQCNEKVYPLMYPTMTVAGQMRFRWGEVGGMFRGWDKCKELSEAYGYFEKMKV